MNFSRHSHQRKLSFQKQGDYVEDQTNELWKVSGALKGLGALFQQQSNSSCYHHEEIYGLGQLMKLLSERLECVEESINTGEPLSTVNTSITDDK